jgi:hypothetical protein
MFDAISSRTTSGFPLSIGTSLAMESVFVPVKPTIDPYRKIPQQINIDDYNQVWINIGTLFRNLYNAVDRNFLGKFDGVDVADALSTEMETIADLVVSSSQGKTESVFYNCSYSDLTNRFKLGTLRLPNTEKQLLYADLYKKSIDNLLKRSQRESIRHIETYQSMFSGGSKSEALILTHFPIDLLNAKKFRSMDLLESHTGILKKPTDWYTKYYDGRDLNMLPLNGILLTVFGDDHHFRPQNRAMKEAVLAFAIERRWTCITSAQEIVNGIKTLKDHALRDALLKQEH